MYNSSDYIAINEAHWRARTRHHIQTDFCNMAAFRSFANSPDELVLGLLADVSGKEVLHRQCHFGQDAISLAWMGAQASGPDFAETSTE